MGIGLCVGGWGGEGGEKARKCWVRRGCGGRGGAGGGMCSPGGQERLQRQGVVNSRQEVLDRRVFVVVVSSICRGQGPAALRWRRPASVKDRCWVRGWGSGPPQSPLQSGGGTDGGGSLVLNPASALPGGLQLAPSLEFPPPPSLPADRARKQ